MILVNSGAFLSISSWFCELTELIFVMIPYISSTGYPPKTQGIMGHVQVANYPTLLPRVQISRETSRNNRYLYSPHSSRPREVQNLGKSEFWEKKSLDNKSLI